MRTKFISLCERSIIINVFAAAVIIGIGAILFGVVVSLFALSNIEAYLFGWISHAEKKTGEKTNNGKHKL
jgi:hypothetical protein